MTNKTPNLSYPCWCLHHRFLTMTNNLNNKVNEEITDDIRDMEELRAEMELYGCSTLEELTELKRVIEIMDQTDRDRREMLEIQKKNRLIYEAEQKKKKEENPDLEFLKILGTVGYMENVNKEIVQKAEEEKKRIEEKKKEEEEIKRIIDTCKSRNEESNILFALRTKEREEKQLKALNDNKNRVEEQAKKELEDKENDKKLQLQITSPYWRGEYENGSRKRKIQQQPEIEIDLEEDSGLIMRKPAHIKPDEVYINGKKFSRKNKKKRLVEIKFHPFTEKKKKSSNSSEYESTDEEQKEQKKKKKK